MSDAPAVWEDDDGQRRFFDAAGITPEEAEAAGGAYTAQLVKQRTPERYNAARFFLANGVGIHRICKLLKMTTHTVIAIREESEADGSLTTEKERLAKRLHAGASLFVESLLDVVADPEQLAKVPAAQRAVIAGILLDKAAALRGDASQVIEHRQGVPDRAAFARFLDGLPRPAVTVTDSGRETTAAKEADAAPGTMPRPALALGDGAGVASDVASDVSRVIPADSGASATYAPRIAAADAGDDREADADADTPGGGGANAGGPVNPV